MKHSFRSLLSRPGNYDAIPAAIAGYLIIQAFARHGGIGVSPDSVVYISTAANIHNHSVINDFTDMPVMDFPAGYPIFLSGILMLTGRACLEFGPVLNGLLFAGLIWVCGWIMDRFSAPSKWYKWSMLIFIVLSPCLLEIYSMIWSETLFILLSLFFIIACHRYFQRHSTRALVIAAGIAGLACITRYAGVSLVGMGGLLMLCDARLPFRKGSLLKKAGHMTLYVLVALAPLALNLYRNRRLTGTFTGYREKGLTSLGENIHDFGSVFCDWLPFFHERYGWATVVGIAFILLITGIFVVRPVKREGFFSYDTIAMSYFIVYTGFILFSATVSRFQQLDSRLLSPLFLPWLWGSTSWIPGALARSPIPCKRVLIVWTIMGAACFFWGEWTTYKLNWNGIRYAGIPGYTEDQWQKSPMMEYIRNNKADMRTPGGSVYSNAFEGLWLLADLQSDLIPHKDIPGDIRDMMKGDHFTVIWFNDSENDDLISIDYIRRYKKLSDQRSFPDGTIYFFTTPPPEAAR